MAGDQDGLTELMASVAGSLHQQAQVEEMLRAVVFSARDTVPGVDEAGISVVSRQRRFATAAATAPIVYQLDDLQYQLGEGPCVNALNGDWDTSTSHLSIDLRWPRYAARAAPLRVESQLALQLFDERGSAAALNLYSYRPEAFGPESIHLADLFATQAAYALGRTTDHDQLSDAISTRRVIGHAVGIVMERHRMTEDQAFALLVRTSQAHNQKLGVVATQIVSDVEANAAPEQPMDAA